MRKTLRRQPRKNTLRRTRASSVLANGVLTGPAK